MLVVGVFVGASWIFIVAAFAVAALVALLMYGQGGAPCLIRRRLITGIAFGFLHRKATPPNTA